MVKNDLNEKDQRHIPCERNLPLASMLQIYLLYLKGFLLYVLCSVFCVLCSVFCVLCSRIVSGEFYVSRVFLRKC